MSVLNIYRDEKIFYHHSIDEKSAKTVFSAHFHDMYEVLFVLTGEGNFCVEGNSYPFRSQRIFVTKTGETHVMQLCSEKPYERVAVHFSKSLIPEYAAFLSAPLQTRRLGTNNAYDFHKLEPSATLMTTIPDSYRGDQLKTFIVARLLAFLCDLSAAYQVTNNNTVKASGSPIQNALGYITLHIFDDISLDDVARAAYLSRSQLCRLFREQLGTTVFEYIRAKRLLAAKEMLANGLDAASVSQKCNFGSYSTFYRNYVSFFGKSPGIYKKTVGSSGEIKS